MTNAAPTGHAAAGARDRHLRRRQASERRFRVLGRIAAWGSLAFLACLLGTMLVQGVRGFEQTWIEVPIDLSRVHAASTIAELDDAIDRGARAAFGSAGDAMVADTAWLTVRETARRALTSRQGPTLMRLPASSAVDRALRQPSPPATLTRLREQGRLGTRFDGTFLTSSDSTDATHVGIWGALKGSLLTMAVTLALAFPIGLFAALWLEEYAPRNRWSGVIEVSINNLAAVPSIVFGLLGLAVFLGPFGLPRSAPLVGGLTLALMTMPVIVITGRSAIRSVPPSVREAALAVGASRVRVTFDHVLPLALPGILTGTIIGMARALGETAPLLLIGMRAFIARPPRGLTDPATVLPVQIFLWSDEVGHGFVEKTSAAILVLLAFLLAMNALAIHLRHRFERRW